MSARDALRWLFLAWVIAVVVAWPVPARALPKDETRTGPPILFLFDPDAAAPTSSPPRSALDALPPSARFVATYRDAPADVRAAVEHALSLWSRVIVSASPIRVHVVWTPMESRVLGSASLRYVVEEGAQLLTPLALADARAGRETRPNAAAIVIELNSAFPRWHLARDGQPPRETVDLVTVVLHEIGHGLGFAASFDVVNGVGAWGFGDGTPTVYDRFVAIDGGQPLLALANGSADLARALVSDRLVWGGHNARLRNGGTRPRLHAPNPFAPGSSVSHLNDATYPDTGGNGLMTPRIGAGIAMHDPGPIVRGILQDLGWRINDGWPGGPRGWAVGAIVRAPVPTVTPTPIRSDHVVRTPSPALTSIGPP